MPSDPQFFPSAAEFRAWLKANHADAQDVLVGYVKMHVKDRRGADSASMTWPESVAEALCYGWIDGIRKSLGAERYTIRFTPRRNGSKWSAVNIRLMAALEAAGRMTDSGRAAFEVRPHKTGPLANGYTAQKKNAELDATRLREFRKHKKAWEFFGAQPPGYRRSMAWWVMQAKQEETRARRLAKLIELSEAGKRLT
jgi:uncharacterized protein YdeI (YjbR/CyaY-like superfamily)